MTKDRVRSQYEAYPYPARDPRDEKTRLIVGSPGHLAEVNHYVFGGRRDFSKPFRVLVAGGGTGDATIMLAQQLADAGGGGEVVYLDMSRASRELCEERAKVRGLTNVRFETGSLLDVAEMGLGTFDYVDCCGVLHHLDSPEAGLAALRSVLSDDGGMGLMLYGELGRTGVYHMQDMMHMMAGDAEEAEQVVLAKKLLGALPDTNWLKRNPFVGDHLEGGDAGLYDLLLHSRDRAYRVPEVLDLAESAGMAVTAFLEPLRYDPAAYLADPRLTKGLDGLGRWQRAAFAELLAGNMRKHIFYLVPKERSDKAVTEAAGDAVPHFHDMDGPEWAKGFRPGAVITATIDAHTFRLPLPRLTGAMAARMDGVRSLDEVFADMKESNASLERDTFDAQFAELFRVLNGLGRLFLSRPPN